MKVLKVIGKVLLVILCFVLKLAAKVALFIVSGGFVVAGAVVMLLRMLSDKILKIAGVLSLVGGLMYIYIEQMDIYAAVAFITAALFFLGGFFLDLIVVALIAVAASVKLASSNIKLFRGKYSYGI